MIFHQSTFDPWPIEDGSVQAIITSPPYWGLRKYDIPEIRINGWRGQHGLEETYQKYIEHVLIWCREAWRVLRGDGVLFLNIGDTYGGSWGAYSHKTGPGGYGHNGFDRGPKGIRPDFLPPPARAQKKCKLKIPDRIAIALIDEGWILRDEIIWYKPNCIPESVKDRMTRRYEPVFMLTKGSKYYFDLDAIRVPYKPDSYRRFKHGYRPQLIPDEALPGRKKPHRRNYGMNPAGANPGNVWKISVDRRPGIAHYSMFPEALVERLVKCSTRPGDVVLDPFCGSGTTLLVARRLERRGIGIDLGYQDIQAQRLGTESHSKALNPGEEEAGT